MNVLLVRVDAELELVVAAGLDDGRVASVKLGSVQVVCVLLVLQFNGKKMISHDDIV